MNLCHRPAVVGTLRHVDNDDRVADPAATEPHRIRALRAARGMLADSLEGRNRVAVFDATVPASVEDMEIGCLKACNRSARALVYSDDEGDMRTQSQLPIPARCCSYDQSGHLFSLLLDAPAASVSRSHTRTRFWGAGGGWQNHAVVSRGSGCRGAWGGEPNAADKETPFVGCWRGGRSYS